MELTLPDNSVRELEKGSNGYDLAKDIGLSLIHISEPTRPS